MLTQNAHKNNRDQVHFFCMDDLIPQDHLLRLIDKAIDWSFIYDLVEDKYSQDNGRPAMNMKAGLTFACMNLKKLIKMLQRKGKGFFLSYSISKKTPCFAAAV